MYCMIQALIATSDPQLQQDVWTEILLASVGEQLSETISEGMI